MSSISILSRKVDNRLIISQINYHDGYTYWSSVDIFISIKMYTSVRIIYAFPISFVGLSTDNLQLHFCIETTYFCLTLLELNKLQWQSDY